MYHSYLKTQTVPHINFNFYKTNSHQVPNYSFRSNPNEPSDLLINIKQVNFPNGPRKQYRTSAPKANTLTDEISEKKNSSIT